MANTSVWERLQAVDRRILYLLLIVFATVSLFFKVIVPTKPGAPVKDFYRSVMAIPEGKTIILQSDFTQSTRGESSGQMEALLRILMRKNVKFALLSVADPQAPLVALNVIRAINQERKAKGERVYERWTDFVNLGYFPNAEGTANSMASNLTTAMAGRRDAAPGAGPTDVFQSPVLQGIRTVGDVPAYINVTGSKTSNILIERLGKKVPFYAMVTGVMGPETLNYYASGQVKGVVIGLNGVAEIETLMDKGLPAENGDEAVPGFEGQINLGRGTGYYLALHACLTLMILAIVIGNVAMVVTRRKK